MALPELFRNPLIRQYVHLPVRQNRRINHLVILEDLCETSASTVIMMQEAYRCGQKLKDEYEPGIIFRQYL